ncbi:unnamed protein product [Adineta ricciae]|uniref:UDENN domain-containing protein n=1 Tax=Adineta ricciae TaxID=249248 RepID=A0A815PS90_ADIRI|nr:unnamed protein product [Adineta ricciae]
MPLLNAFIDSIVCVGFNSEHGFTPERQLDDSPSLLASKLKPYVLAILTADQAIYPRSKGTDVIDQFYPSVCYTPSSTIPRSQKKPTIPAAYKDLPVFCSPDGVKLSYEPVQSRIHHIVFTQEDGKRSYVVVLTFSEKFILKTDKPDDDGRYHIESFSTKKSKRKIPSSYPGNTAVPQKSTAPTGGSRMRERSNSNASNRVSTTIFNAHEPFYLPHCLVLISSHPYWRAMQETISIIHDEIIHSNIEPSSNTYKQLIQKYAFLACHTPIPPASWEHFSLPLTVTNKEYVLTLDPPLNPNRPVLDIDLSLLLLTLNIGKLLDVLSAILTQQPIIFFSSDYSKLVATLECLLYLIYPFKWIHIYVPIVPDGLSDYYLEGPPGSYIMGVHSRHQSIVESLNYCLTCNLDTDENLQIPSMIPFYPIPPANLRHFVGPITQFTEQIKTARSLQNMNTLGRLRIDQQRELDRQDRIATNYRIIEIFLDLMVDLCADTLQPIYWMINHQQKSSSNSLPRTSTLERTNRISNQTSFRKEKYLLSKTEGVEQEFYKLFLDSTAFQLFLEEEIASETSTEFQKISQLRSHTNQDPTFHFNTDSADEHVHSTISLFNTTIGQLFLPLPDWPTDVTTHYLDSCIEILTIEFDIAQEESSQPMITFYAYLRGCALLSRGRLIEGLQDLYLIDNPNLFPKTYIETVIVPQLSETNSLDLFLHESFYTHCLEWKKIQTQSTHSNVLNNNTDTYRNPSDDHNDIKSPTPPKDHLSFEQFYEYIQRLSIVNDREIAKIIFDALLQSSTGSRKPAADTLKQRRRWSISGGIFDRTYDTLSNSHQPAQNNISLSSKHFEQFSDIWQQTNAEKARINSHLPKDRQKYETILIISSFDIVSRKDVNAKLILTQRSLYSFHDAHSSARLLTEVSNIVFIETYQHKALFTSAKPAIRIFAMRESQKPSSASEQKPEPVMVLLCKDNQEQNFWYKILQELWFAVLIAQKECDTIILHKASRHINLIDTLASIDYNKQILPAKLLEKPKQNYHQMNLDITLDKLTIYTQMYNNGAYKALTNETRRVLHSRLSPSMNEIEQHAVRCLVFTENPDSRYSILWCAYGAKLKMFNTTTWMCNLNDMLFPSLITCMCSDACDKLWIGCLGGQVFIVDTIQMICGAQLTSIQGCGGCQAMAFDSVHNRMFIANRDGFVIIWNTHNRQRLFDVNLQDIYKKTYGMQQKIYKTEVLLNLRNPNEEPTTNTHSSVRSQEIISTFSNELKTIQVYEDLLFACYRDDYILIFRMINTDTYIYEDAVSIKYSQDSSMPINSFLVYNRQLWISTGYILYVFNITPGSKKNSYHLIMKKHIEDDHLLTMLGLTNYIWAGSSRAFCASLVVFKHSSKIGRTAQEAVAYISSRGLKPVVVQANQPVTMDFSTNRVRIVVDPTGRTVIQTPTVG